MFMFSTAGELRVGMGVLEVNCVWKVSCEWKVSCVWVWYWR